MKIAAIIGARPQFIKAAAISRAIAAHNRLTGEIEGHDAASCPPIPNSHGRQTGRMLMAIEEVLLKEKPDWVGISFRS